MTRLVLCLLLVLTGAAEAADAFDPFDEAGIDKRPGAQVPLDLTFQQANGARATLRQLGAGKPIVLAPVLHHCPNICGVTLGGLAQAIRAQGFKAGRDFTVVAFGIDPKEGPDAAQNSLDELRAGFPDLPTQGVHAVTGSADDVAAVTRALGYRYAFDARIAQYAHVAAVAVLTPDGRSARWLYGLAPEPTDLKLALTEAGEGRLGDWGDQLLLLCYHYDPKTGRYGSLISWLLQLGGGATVVFMAGFIGLSALRERRLKAGGRS
ncbi:MAG: SCO family protein [Rhizobiales bacterium 24-66-13]|jgi:protein SCO1/2|uniref:SCO family protein n=1 Tax=Roseixanthobacter finlandensis TaxID=3119922 RepID=UPI000BD5477A|nr:MAG: SCO family protein [Rhizobiales bacterium 35-66-30]OYZ82924.1 MAG: SCO family protein [Rhizobiales bacterium 24-66-13]OZB11910.1 MAG: SCO family protein [Rhizobiales bacterium 39-66-18]HQS08528.1 SCO family protein [Xanthobacteraceae bacterium]HQS45418.1 SCO family protein [Xanthobacteraceae bacterium]